MAINDGFLRTGAEEARIALRKIMETIAALSLVGTDVPEALTQEQQRLAAIVADEAV